MARQAANLEDALNKKGGLTLSQLANYDDWATDALVDKVCIRAARQNICAILTECDRFTSGLTSANSKPRTMAVDISHKKRCARYYSRKLSSIRMLARHKSCY